MAGWRADGTYDPNAPPGGGGGGIGDSISGALGGAASAAKGALGPSQADLGPARQVIGRAFTTQDELNKERQSFGGAYDPTRANSIFGQQQQAIGGLQAAANGLVPSAAQIMLQQQANRGAAQQFGLAQALQGRSPGGALRQASMGAAQVQGDAAAQAAQMRAQEQANARAQLVQGLGGIYGQQTDLRGQDLGYRQALLGGDLSALNSAAGAAGAYSQASANNAAANNQFKGNLIGLGANLLSDKREKTDIKPADLGKLADSLKGFRYKYKDQANGEGERVGIMAQDAAKGGPVGERMVNLGSDGKLRLDVGNAVGAALAMSAAALRKARGEAQN